MASCLATQVSTLVVLFSILAGVAVGVFLRYSGGWTQEQIIWFSLPGELFMRLLTCLSMPLVLPKLVSAIGSMDPTTGGRILFKVLLFYGILNIMIETTGILVFFAINSTEAIEEKTNITGAVETSLPLSYAVHDLLFNLVPENIFTAPFLRYQTVPTETNNTMSYHGKHVEHTNILGLVAAATALGVTIAHVGEEASSILQFFTSLSLLTSLMMEVVIKWMCPLGLASLVATQIVTVKYPSKSLGHLTKFVVTMLAGNLLLPLLILPLVYLTITQFNPVKFFGQMGEALLVNFGTASSISTFPVTLRCLTEKNKMDHKESSLVLSLGVLINICSYPMIAVLYVAEQEGRGLTTTQIMMTMIILTTIAYGTSGIPQDSFMTVLLVCGMHGIPTTMLTHVLAVDWMLDRIDGFCKVLTDATAVGVICTRESEDTGEEVGDDILF